MRWHGKVLNAGLLGGLFLALAPAGFAQKPAMASKAAPPPMAHPAPPANPQPNQNVVVVEPIRVFDPFYTYPYPYAYPPDYMAQNFGYVKLKTDLKNASVYVDGGFADRIAKAKKFALRPGNHEIEVRDTEGATLFKQKVDVLVGKTTELKVG
jgi:hypothetical protein